MGEATLLVYLVRHGQSYNTHPEPDDPMPVNPPLTPAGQAEARLVARRLCRLGIERLVCSPMLRTIETALHVAAETGLPIEIWPRCYEYRATYGYRCWGAAGLRPRYPELVMPPDFSEDDWDYGNEALESGTQRAEELLRWIEAEAGRAGLSRLAVVTHGTFTRLVLGWILGAELEGLRRIWFDNTAVNTLELTCRGFRVKGLNDTLHLAGVDGLDPAAGITR